MNRAKTITFPRYSLEKCENRLGKIPPAKAISREDMLEKIGYTNPSSGPAGSAMGALSMYGLVRKKESLYEITELGKALRNPLSEKQASVLRVISFLLPEKFREIYDRLKGREIDESGYISSLISQLYTLPENASSEFEEGMVESGIYAGVFRKSEKEGKVEVLNMEPMISALDINFEEILEDQTELVRALTIPDEIEQTFGLLPGKSGETRSIREEEVKPRIEMEEITGERDIDLKDLSSVLDGEQDLVQFNIQGTTYVVTREELIAFVRRNGQTIGDDAIAL